MGAAVLSMQVVVFCSSMRIRLLDCSFDWTCFAGALYSVF